MIQQIVNILYRYPKSDLLKYKRFGGYLNYRRMMANCKLMQKASLNLTPIASHNDGLSVYFLTGKKYLYQTLFCIKSLSIVTRSKFKFILVDDGSFDSALITQVSHQLPGAEVILKPQIELNLQNKLPEQQYPNLYDKRKVYPHIKKLTDIHSIPNNEWKLVLDADMMFWADPVEIINWLQNPTQPLYMLDCVQSYGYSIKLMEELCGLKVPELLNVGVIGLHSSSINWQSIENWMKALEETEGASYYLEQALTAMLIGESQAYVLPSNDYIVNPDVDTINHKKGILHHYVDLSKEGYFKKAWKKI